MGVLASAQELLTAFIGLEMSSISSYVLAGYRRESLKAGESAMKYFLLGSFATAFFLYGIALVYGVTGTTNLLQMGHADTTGTLPKLGFALILIGLGFKVAAAPFQVWTPDVYEGAPRR
jgi:NADH-quinone oxidoreductase subunit N